MTQELLLCTNPAKNPPFLAKQADSTNNLAQSIFTSHVIRMHTYR